MLISIDILYTATQEYKVRNITLFKFTAYTAYRSLQKITIHMARHLFRDVYRKE